MKTKEALVENTVFGNLNVCPQNKMNAVLTLLGVELILTWNSSMSSIYNSLEAAATNPMLVEVLTFLAYPEKNIKLETIWVMKAKLHF